jgi:hypothetical protein
VRVTFQLTSEDYDQGLLAWRNLRASRRWLIRIIYFVLIVAFLASLLALLLDRNGALARSFLPLLWVSTISFALTWFGPRLSARRQFRNTPSAHDPMTIEASDAGLEIHSVHADSKVAWSAYMAWGESKSVFVILSQPRIYVPIPKRAFAPEQLVEFRELLARNIRARSK